MRKTKAQRNKQKSSRKMNDMCVSRMYLDEYIDQHVEVMYISAHTNHQVAATELKHLPLPKSTRDEVSQKVSQGITAERILEGKSLLFIFFIITPPTH